MKLDAFDHRLLAELQHDARLPMQMLAERAGLSAPACYRRVRRLRAIGAIEREKAVVSPRTLGWPLLMIVLVALDHEDASTTDAIRRTFEKEVAVVEAWQVTGEHDFVVKIIARDMEDYDALTHRIFVRNDKIRSFKTLVVLRHTKAAGLIPWAEDRE